jgi:hypothetical protein
MATPNDRRVIWGSYVIPQVSFSTTSTQVTREEGSTAGTASYTDYKLDTTVAKRFGGKGSVDINSDQAVDGWVSFLSPVDNLWEAVDNVWNLDQTTWDGERGVTTSAAVLRSDTVNIDFLYVKNLGSVECQLALEGDEFDILIPGGAAVSMRVNSVSSANIKVQTASSTTTIEYVIAKTP